MSVIHPGESLQNTAPALAGGRVRFGLTVSRRQARRAVARNAVKRVLRESARLRAPHLEAAAAGRPVDVLFRLKAPLPVAATASWAEVKVQLRREADSLLEQLLGVLRSGDSLAGSVQSPRLSLAQSHGRKDARAPSPRAQAASKPAQA